ncbi:hypothetical protein HF086_018131 [Spodoptera exigua]|uniref:Peptidase A2 domain-containing protein n=1 Tax=Spodoptera exigua TaxID=7107 RepID=A0A922MND9_SPOEX|nr:hypothetical protein HF086_018131 [Spodoptera exigua]
MPRITRATRAQIEHKAEEQGSDGYSDSDCDSVVEPRAHAGAATTQSRDAYDATEETRAQGSAALDHTLGGARTGAPAATEEPRARRGAALDHTLGEAQTGAPAAAPNTERLLSTMMESFARMQAETNRTFVETLRSLRHGGDTWSPVTSTPAASPSANTPAACGGNFSKCTARFDGQSRDPEVLEAFIDAVEVYKECAGVTDDHALRGLSMLLNGDAALWWRGARAAVGSWPDALARLRATYGVRKPAHMILREVFQCKQSECERAEVFVSKVRCLLIQLPYSVPNEMMVDIVYGLLHRRIRKRVSRDTITDIEHLLERARLTEDSITELKISNVPANNSNIPTVPDRSITTSSNATTSPKLTSNSNESSKRNRFRCSFCRSFSHAANECRKAANKVDSKDSSSKVGNTSVSTISNTIRCYGCGQAGVVKSKCETCSGKSTSAPGKSADFNVVKGDFFATMMSSHPLVAISVVGKEGVAILDTGATHSVASPMLYSLLINNGIEFHETERYVGLADGSCHRKTIKTATVPVTLNSRRVNTEFMVFPGDDTRTLLGRDFIAQAEIVLDIAQESWHFADSPGDRYSFLQSFVLNSATVAQVDISDVSHEGTCLSPEQFASAGPPTDFAVHKIKLKSLGKGFGNSTKLQEEAS